MSTQLWAVGSAGGGSTAARPPKLVCRGLNLDVANSRLRDGVRCACCCKGERYACGVWAEGRRWKRRVSARVSDLGCGSVNRR